MALVARWLSRWTTAVLFATAWASTGFAQTTASFQDGVSPAATYAGTRDTFIRSTSSTTNFGTANSLQSDTIEATLLKWDVGSIPPGSIVSSATITVRVANPSTQVYEIYEVLRNWVETQATWIVFATGQSWAVAGALGALDRGSTVLGTITGGSGSVSIILNASGVSLVQSWVNTPASNFGITIQDYSNTDGIHLRSREAATATDHPELIVSYTPPDTTAPTITNVTSSTPNGTYGAGAAINVTVNFSEPVTLAGGNLNVTLDTGAVVAIGPFGPAASASGTYTVAAGQNSPDLNALSPLTLAAGATLKDAAGNDAILTIPAGGNLADLKAIVIDTTAPTISVVKSVSPAGNQPPGTTLTYTVVVTNSGTGAASSVVLTDPIPANTTYVAGSITQDGAGRSDAADADNADYNVTNPGKVTVTIGALAASGGTTTLTFQMTIN